MLTSGVRNATAALIEQEQSQEDDEVEDHPRCKDKRCRAEPEEDSMADETRGDDDGSQDQAAAGDGGNREERTVWMRLSLLDAVVSSLCYP